MTLPLPVRQLLRHPIRSGLAGLGIAVAAALLFDMVMLSGGMERSFRNLLLSRGFQIRISPKGTLPFDTEATLGNASALAAELRQRSGVVAAGPVLAIVLYTHHADSLISLVAYGVDPRGQGLYQIAGGSDLAPADTGALLVGSPVRERLGWNLGDTVTVLSRLDPEAGTSQARARLVVRGIADWLYDARDQLSVGISLPLAQRLSRTPIGDRASFLMVKVAQNDQADATAREIAKAHPEVQVNSISTLVEQFRRRLSYFRQLSTILATISLVVAVLLIGTILTITVNERLLEIATLRAIGVSRGRIVGQVMLEGLALTVMGTVLGLGLGAVTARYLDQILTSFPGLPAAISFFVPEPGALTRTALALIATGGIAGAYPAWLAARASIAATLRAEAA